MKFSSYGKRVSGPSGINELMVDLGDALANRPDMIMMGGGNPGRIPEVESAFRQQLAEIAESTELSAQVTGIYDEPQGDAKFRSVLADYLSEKFGVSVGANNIAVTNGTQSSLHMLFNLFAGVDDHGVTNRILLPMAPEYIGYAEAGIAPNMFVSAKPIIEDLDDRFFRYRPDFETLETIDNIGAICLSRPSNPTGNVLCFDDLARLDSLAIDKGVPLIIDGAYGLPFPNLVYREAKPYLSDNTILTLSLSKVGLPAARTGLVIANEEVIRAVSSMNAVLALSPGSLGQMLATNLLSNHELDRLCEESIRPYYLDQRESALVAVADCFDPHNFDYRIHAPDGAMFLWLHFPSLSITSKQLYQALKDRGVLVVSGHYFFYGLDSDWSHQHQCIRVTYSQNKAKVREGLRVIADVISHIHLSSQ